MEQDVTFSMGAGVDSGLLRFILDIEATLDKLELFLRGVQNRIVEADEEGEKKIYLVQEKGKPLLSEDGIKFIMSTLRSIATKDVFVSNFSEKETYNNIRSISLSILKELWVHYEIGDWEIKDISTLMQIYNMCYIFIFSSLKRPYREGERNFMKHTVEERHIFTPKKVSFLGGGE